jgi:P27 family predicted phage terminase small subunit
MPKPGPAPTPTKKLALRGSWRAATRPGEPRPEPEAPPRPESLPPAAAAVWDEVLPQLGAAGLLGRVDGRSFTRYCELFPVWDDLMSFLRKSGHAHPVKNAKGEVVGVRPYPQLRLALQVSEHLLRLENQFGMTPAARARLVVEPLLPPTPALEHYFQPRRLGG